MKEKKSKAFLPAAIIAGITATAGTIFYKVRKEQKTFTAEKWNNDIQRRYLMADNLIRNDYLIGKTHEEVLDFLGINGLRSNTKEAMEYYLSLDTDEPKLLIIEFNEDDEVIKCTACV